MAQAPNPEPFRSKCLELKLLTAAQADELVSIQKQLATMGLSTEYLDVAKQKGFLTAAQVESVHAALANAGTSSQKQRAVKELGGFEVVGKIGEGAMGVVYKARQKSLDRIVALKILPPRFAKDKVFVERFLREARASATLNHPNVVQGIDAGEENGLYYFAMEFIEGETVLQRFKREGALPVKDVLEIGKQTAQALAHAHGKGLIHRDIKPDNLMLTSVGSRNAMSVKVMDLGLARMVSDDASMTEAGKTLGTPFYISPEQARGVKELTPACDLYALGGTLLHIVSGKPPYSGETSAVIMSKHLNDPPPNPKALKPNLPDDVAAILKKLLAKKPEDRYPSAEALAEDLDLVIAGDRPKFVGGTRGANKSTGPVRPITSRQKEVTTGRKRPVGSPEDPEPAPKKGLPMPIILGGAAALLIVLGLVLALGGKKDPPPTQAKVPPAKTTETKTEAKSPAETQPDPGEAARVKAEQDKAARLKRLDEQFKAAQNLAQQEPDNYEKVRRAWLDLRADGIDTEFEKRAEAALTALEQKRKGEIDKALQDTLASAKTAAQAGDFDKALAELGKLPPAMITTQGREALDAAKKEIEDGARAEGDKRLKAAADLLAAGKQEDALNAYGEIAAFKFAPVAAEGKAKSDELKAAIDQARAAADATASKGFAALVAKLSELVPERKLEDAQAEIAKVLHDRAMAPKHEDVRAVAEALNGIGALNAAVGRRLAAAGEKGCTLPGAPAVYFKFEKDRIYFKPTPDFPQTTSKGVEYFPLKDLVALAQLDDVKQAVAVKSVPKEDLLPLGGLLALLGFGEPASALFARAESDLGEAAAGKVKTLKSLTDGAVSMEATSGDADGLVDKLRTLVAGSKWKEAKAVLDLLENEKLRATETVQKNRKEIDALGGKILDALIEAEAANINVLSLFKGKARQLTGNTFEILYDFEDPSQLQDFQGTNGTWTVKDGKLQAAPPNDALLWLKFPLAGDNIELSFDVEAKSEVGCLLAPEIKNDPFAGYAFRFGRNNNQQSELFLNAVDKPLAKSKSRLNPSRPNQIAIAKRGPGFMGQIAGGTEPLSFNDPKAQLCQYAAWYALDNAAFDNLRVRVQVDPEWLKSEKTKIARRQYYARNKSDYEKKLQRIFRGTVTDLGGGRIRISYDFSTTDQLEDFECVGAKPVLVGGELDFEKKDDPRSVLYHRGRWLPPVQAEVKSTSINRLILNGAALGDLSHVDKCWQEGFHVSAGRDNQAYLENYSGDRKPAVAFTLVSPGHLKLEFDGAEWKFLKDEQVVLSWKDPSPRDANKYNRWALVRWEDQKYSSYSISGTLDPNWLKSELEKQ